MHIKSKLSLFIYLTFSFQIFIYLIWALKFVDPVSIYIYIIDFNFYLCFILDVNFVIILVHSTIQLTVHVYTKPVYSIYVLKIIWQYMCTQNQFTLCVHTKPNYSTCVHKNLFTVYVYIKPVFSTCVHRNQFSVHVYTKPVLSTSNIVMLIWVPSLWSSLHCNALNSVIVIPSLARTNKQNITMTEITWHYRFI